MARITLNEAKAWAESTKLPMTALDTNLLTQLEDEILSRVSSAYTITSWTSDTTTPSIVRTAIAKMYIATLIRRAYSEDETTDNAYATWLENNAELIISGLLDGSITIPDVPSSTEAGVPSFYPTDASSAMCPTPNDLSLGGPAFSLGQVF